MLRFYPHFMQPRPLLLALALTLAAVAGGGEAAAKAVPFAAELNYTYSQDSDQIKTKAWRLATVNENAPWNVTLYRTRLDQPTRSLLETTALAKYRAVLSKREDALTVWAGVTRNSITDYYPYALMYDTAAGPKGHVWLSHGRESLGTIAAYERRVYADTSALTARYEFGAELTATAEYKRFGYTDGNRRNKLVATVAKKLGNAKLKGGYVYDSADRKAPGVYYVPVGERAWFVGGEYTVPLGDASLVLSGERSFSARNADGGIKRHGAQAELKAGALTAALRFDRAGDYWARGWSLTWRQEW